MSNVAARLYELADTHESQQRPVIDAAASADRSSQLLHLAWQQSCEVGGLLIGSVIAGELGGAIASTVWEVQDIRKAVELDEPYATQLLHSNVFWMVATGAARQASEKPSVELHSSVDATANEPEKVVGLEPNVPLITRQIAQFVESRSKGSSATGDFWWNGRPYRLTKRALRFLTIILSHPGLTTKQLTAEGGHLEGVERGSVERLRARVNSDLEAAGVPFCVGLSEGIWLFK